MKLRFWRLGPTISLSKHKQWFLRYELIWNKEKYGEKMINISWLCFRIFRRNCVN